MLLGSISHFAAKRERTSVARTASPSSGSVSSRKSSGPRRQTRMRRDQPARGGEQQRGDDLARGDVVREHPLEVVLGIRPGDADVGALPARDPLE